MAKPTAAQDDPARAFRKAWKLLGRLESRLGAARKDETKRRRQLAEAKGARALKRQGQLEAALAEIAQVEALLTELSELIAANARARSGRTVGEMAHEAAEAVKAEALAAADATARHAPTAAAVAPEATAARDVTAAEPPAPEWTPPDEPPDEPPAYEPIPGDVPPGSPPDVRGSASG